MTSLLSRMVEEFPGVSGLLRFVDRLRLRKDQTDKLFELGILKLKQKNLLRIFLSECAELGSMDIEGASPDGSESLGILDFLLKIANKLPGERVGGVYVSRKTRFAVEFFKAVSSKSPLYYWKTISRLSNRDINRTYILAAGKRNVACARTLVRIVSKKAKDTWDITQWENDFVTLGGRTTDSLCVRFRRRIPPTINALVETRLEEWLTQSKNLLSTELSPGAKLLFYFCPVALNEDRLGLLTILNDPHPSPPSLQNSYAGFCSKLEEESKRALGLEGLCCYSRQLETTTSMLNAANPRLATHLVSSKPLRPSLNDAKLKNLVATAEECQRFVRRLEAASLDANRD